MMSDWKMAGREVSPRPALLLFLFIIFLSTQGKNKNCNSIYIDTNLGMTIKL